jgi:hypothetical protein
MTDTKNILSTDTTNRFSSSAFVMLSLEEFEYDNLLSNLQT